MTTVTSAEEGASPNPGWEGVRKASLKKRSCNRDLRGQEEMTSREA